LERSVKDGALIVQCSKRIVSNGKSANSCELFCGVIQEEIVDETGEFIDVANKYVHFLR
jgi:hypothetical protein